MYAKLINDSKFGYYFISNKITHYDNIIKQLNKDYTIICTGHTILDTIDHKNKCIVYSYKLFKNNKEIYKIKNVSSDLHTYDYIDSNSSYSSDYLYYKNSKTFVNNMIYSSKCIVISTEDQIKIFRFQDDKEYIFDKTSEEIQNINDYIKFNDSVYNINTMKKSKCFTYVPSTIFKNYSTIPQNEGRFVCFQNKVYDVKTDKLLLEDKCINKISDKVFVTSNGLYEITMDNRKKCDNCNNERIKTKIIIPCGHTKFCDECFKVLKTCPICGTKIDKVIVIK